MEVVFFSTSLKELLINVPKCLISKVGSIGVQGVQTRLKRNVRFESK